MLDILHFFYRYFIYFIQWEPLKWWAALFLVAFGWWFLRQFTGGNY